MARPLFTVSPVSCFCCEAVPCLVWCRWVRFHDLSHAIDRTRLPTRETTAIHYTPHYSKTSGVSLPDGACLVDRIVQIGSRVRSAVWLRVVTVWLVVFLVTPPLIQADEIHLESIGVRGGASGSSPIGKKETQFFKEYDLMANWSLPWGWYSESGWGIGTRLMGSVGALGASDDTAFIATMVPGVVLGKKDGWLSLEVGAGVALLSIHHFDHQEMGGSFQVVGDIALRAKVYRGLGVGYWFHHLSDATLYGDKGRGFDLHMIELSYRF